MGSASEGPFMTPNGLSIPPPHDDDHEDVAWALRAASAQWKREAHQDAIAWVKRAAETAEEVGAFNRSVELAALADALATGAAPKAVAPPPPPRGVAPPPPRAPMQTLGIDVDLDDAEDVDELLEDDIVFEEEEADEEETAKTSIAPNGAAAGSVEMAPTEPPSAFEPPAPVELPSLESPAFDAREPSSPIAQYGEPVIAEQAPGVDLDDDLSYGDRVSSPDLQIGEASLDDLDLGDLGSNLDHSRPEHAAVDGVESPFADEEPPTSPTEVEFSEDEPPTAQVPLPPESGPISGEGVPSSGGEPLSFTGPASEPSPAPEVPLPKSAFPPSGPPAEPFPLAPSAHVPDVEELVREVEAPASAPSPAAAAAAPTAPASVEPASVDGVLLENVNGLADLPEDSQAELARSAEVLALSAGEEARAFAVALVTAGSVDIMPAIADASCARAKRGEVVFTRGTLGDGVALRVVGAEPGTRVAIWNTDHLTEATAACPWVADELSLVADRFQALAGAVMGPLGDSLDDMFRPMVLEKCTVRRFGPGDVLLEKGKQVDGMYIVGAGWVELVKDDGSIAEELGPGDFMFRATILAAGKASHTARAGQGGALMLFAPRMATHELLATCPPFIELVAG